MNPVVLHQDLPTRLRLVEHVEMTQLVIQQSPKHVLELNFSNPFARYEHNLFSFQNNYCRREILVQIGFE